MKQEKGIGYHIAGCKCGFCRIARNELPPWNMGVRGYRTSCRGRKLSPELRAKISTNMKHRWAKGGCSASLDALRRGGDKANDLRKKLGRYDLSVESRQRHRENSIIGTKKAFDSLTEEEKVETRKRQMAGTVRLNERRRIFGRYDLSKETRRRISKKTRQNMQARRKILSEQAKRRWADPQYRERIAQSAKEKWADPQYRERSIRAILKGLRKRPTSFERRIIDLCAKHTLPFKYVGNGQLLVGYGNPDFIETNGRKLLIETYGRFWHPGNYEEKRGALFAKFGFKTLFLNEDVLRAPNWEELCLGKITNFNSSASEVVKIGRT